ncbi:MAG: hypothetical protein QXW44_07905 [Pyrobaculum sp.]
MLCLGGGSGVGFFYVRDKLASFQLAVKEGDEFKRKLIVNFMETYRPLMSKFKACVDFVVSTCPFALEAMVREGMKGVHLISAGAQAL